MQQFTKHNVFILPHAQEYQNLYSIAITDVLTCLNAPDKKEGLTTDHYTAEKTFDKYSLYIYYYVTLPLRSRGDSDVYAVVDFIGFSESEASSRRKSQPDNEHGSV
ncbi:hypothetical protein [Dictyobacter formicarum]|uniref:Uncharacterized protein n=1 Tax=Dictyobacter formicarum TaxID=2778368 RepID=A0ABQ3VHH2_9CHLR|nr:hypothetical protein [Dictyobacter formicarum]GHO85230.1 hypothetical protein KSZ_32360 [Dictyobacter formicarum]